MTRWPGGVKKTRCDYCAAPPVVWLWYTTRLPYRGPYRTSGTVPMNAASCGDHEYCANFTGLRDLHLHDGRIERQTTRRLP